MSILDQLSSQVGDRSENANRKVAMQCIDKPALLAEIAAGLNSKSSALTGDCAEVMTQVAEQHPDWVAPYAQALSALLSHKTTRVRWEAMHAIAFVAAFAPETIQSLLPTLAEMMRSDSSIIVRVYSVDAIGNYAAAGKSAAEEAYPLLVEALSLWEGRHAGHALKGLVNVARDVPDHHAELRGIAEEYSSSGKAVVRKAARDLLKAIGPTSNMASK